MSTSAEQINELIGDYTDLKGYFEGARGSIDAKIDNLPATIRSLSAFAATWDPDEANPDNIDGGVFSDLDALVNTAPRGSTIYVTIPSGREVLMPLERIYINSRYVRFSSSDPANRATIKFPAHINAVGNNARYRFHLVNAAEVMFQDVNLTLMPKVDPAQIWHASQSAILAATYAHKVRCRFSDCHIVGDDDGFITTCSHGILVEASLHEVTFSGAFTFAANTDDGIAIIAASNLTFAGGATLQTGGTPVTGTVLNN
ncbi:hypothetical protein [Profundibacter sp.]